jgi:hypothetical protein
MKSGLLAGRLGDTVPALGVGIANRLVGVVAVDVELGIRARLLP